MRAYNDLIKQYTDCLKSEHDAAVAKIDPAWLQDKKEGRRTSSTRCWQEKNDAAVDEASEVTGRFNDQIKAYNAAHKTELISRRGDPRCSMNTPAPAPTDSRPAGTSGAGAG